MVFVAACDTVADGVAVPDGSADAAAPDQGAGAGADAGAGYRLPEGSLLVQGKPCVPPPVVRKDWLGFHDVAGATGLVHSGKYPLDHIGGPGVCTADFDGDGDVDAFWPRPSANLLYLNDGGTFVLRPGSDIAGPGDANACLALDYDNDGRTDVLVAGLGWARLYRNEGAGFRDVTEQVALGPVSGWIWTLGAGDIDSDGDLDIVVAPHVLDMGSADLLPPLLFVNQAGEAFAEEAAARGVTATGPAFAALFVDLDQDRDVDLYVGNDGGYAVADYAYVNDGAGHFDERGRDLGLDFNDRRDSADTMGVDCGDFDLDGVPDCVVTNYQGRSPLAYRGRVEGGALRFTDVAVSMGLTPGWTGWGMLLADFDHDGALDLFRANALTTGGSSTLDDVVAWNEGGAFVEQALGDGEPGYGVAQIDYDADGDLDVLVAQAERPALWENRAANGHWLKVRLRGTVSNRDGVGALVTVDLAGGCRLTEQKFAGGSFASSYGPDLHFGLGDRDRTTVTVRWPSGTDQTLEDVAADQTVTIVEP